MFFQDLSHDFLAEYYYRSPISIPITAKPHVTTSDPGQVFEASPSLVSNEGQNPMAGSTTVSWMVWIKLR